MPHVTRRDATTLVVHGPFRDDAYAHLTLSLESTRQIRLPHTAFRCASTTHNARVIDACPQSLRWDCDKPSPPVSVSTSDAPARMRTKPYSHQLKEYLRSRDLSAFMLSWEMGTGKTKTGIDTAVHLYEELRINRVLVATVKGVHRQWALEEFPKHCAAPFEAFVWQSGGLPKRELLRLRQVLAEDCAPLVVLCINVDALATDVGMKFATEFLKGGPALFVVDESHTIKTPSAARTKAITRLGTLAPYRRTLTGTPITRGTEDLFAQYRFLDPNIIGAKTYAAFCSEYCVFGGYQNHAIVGYRNVARLNAMLAPYTSRVTKADCLDLPPKVYVTREVALSVEQATAYKTARKNFDEALASEDFNITTALELLTRLRQVCGGHLPDGTALPCGRVDAVCEAVTQCEGPVVVWAVYRAEVARLAKALAGVDKRRTYLYDGSVSDCQREENLAAYKADPRGILVANPAAGGTGLNLDGAPLVVYYSHSFNAGHRWQSEDRTHRATTRHSVTYLDLLAPNTVEARVIAALKRKQGVANMTLEELRANFLADV